MRGYCERRVWQRTSTCVPADTLYLARTDALLQLTRYTIATILSGLLEACSMQNDNLVIPIYMWSLVTLIGV